MSAFRTHGRGHLNGPVVVVGTGLLGTSIGLGLRGRGVAVFLSDPSPTNQAVAVDIGAGLPLARLDGEQPELVVVAAPPDVTADVVERALADYPEATVVDIASVKAGIQAELRSPRRRPRPLRGHPPDGGPGKVRPRRCPRRTVHLHAVGPVPLGGDPARGPAGGARAGRGPRRRRLRVRGRGTRRGRGACLARAPGGVLARGQPAAGHAAACAVPRRQRAAGRHPDRGERPDPVGADPRRATRTRSWRSCTASARTSTGSSARWRTRRRPVPGWTLPS